VSPPAPSAAPAAAPTAAAVPAGRASGWLPRGRALSDQDFAWRHRVVCLLLVAHLPLLLGIALLRGRGPAQGLLEVAPVALLLALSLAPVRRGARALAASLGLLTCSALLVDLFDGRPAVGSHYVVAVAVVALYQDWAVYALAICFVVLQVGLVGVLDPSLVHLRGGGTWGWAAARAGFVLAESAVLVTFWRATEQARAAEDRMQSALVEGRTSVRARLEDADRIRADLIGTVSHEFRTPLTGIRGAALTLLRHGDKLDPTGRTALLQAVLDQQERLSRLLENMLTAAGATDADTGAVSDVEAVAAEIGMLAGAEHPDRPPPTVVVEPGLLARIDDGALHQVLANLVDNARQHGSAESQPLVAAGQDAHGVWVAVSNEGATLDVTSAGRLFEPFTQADAGPTRDREGLGMGLYVVRRLVEVHGGRVEVRSGEGWVTVEVRLPAPALTVPREQVAAH